MDKEYEWENEADEIKDKELERLSKRLRGIFDYSDLPSDLQSIIDRSEISEWPYPSNVFNEISQEEIDEDIRELLYHGWEYVWNGYSMNFRQKGVRQNGLKDA